MALGVGSDSYRAPRHLDVDQPAEDRLATLHTS